MILMKSISVPDEIGHRAKAPFTLEEGMTDRTAKIRLHDDFLFIEEHARHRNISGQRSFLPRVDSFETSGETDTRSEQSRSCEGCTHQTLHHAQPTGLVNSPSRAKDADQARALACIDELGSVIGGPPFDSMLTRQISIDSVNNVTRAQNSELLRPMSDSFLSSIPERKQREKSPAIRRSIFSNLVHQNSRSQSSVTMMLSPDEPLLSTIQLARCGSAPVLMHRTQAPGKPSLKGVASESTANKYSSSSGLKRSVSFSKLEIREYNVALSDNPSCSNGPPIQLGWDYRDQEAVEVDLYESGRLPRRRMHQMALSYNVRRYLLMHRAGCTVKEIENAVDEVNRVKRERMITDILMPASKIDERREEVMDRIKSIFVRRPACKSV